MIVMSGPNTEVGASGARMITCPGIAPFCDVGWDMGCANGGGAFGCGAEESVPVVRAGSGVETRLNIYNPQKLVTLTLARIRLFQ